MMLSEDVFQVTRELTRQLGVKISDVGNQIDQIVELLDFLDGGGLRG
jgi:hypothetical protein